MTNMNLPHLSNKRTKSVVTPSEKQKITLGAEREVKTPSLNASETPFTPGTAPKKSEVKKLKLTQRDNPVSSEKPTGWTSPRHEKKQPSGNPNAHFTDRKKPNSLEQLEAELQKLSRLVDEQPIEVSIKKPQTQENKPASEKPSLEDLAQDLDQLLFEVQKESNSEEYLKTHSSEEGGEVYLQPLKPQQETEKRVKNRLERTRTNKDQVQEQDPHNPSSPQKKPVKVLSKQQRVPLLRLKTQNPEDKQKKSPVGTEMLENEWMIEKIILETAYEAEPVSKRKETQFGLEDFLTSGALTQEIVSPTKEEPKTIRQSRFASLPKQKKPLLPVLHSMHKTTEEGDEERYTPPTSPRKILNDTADFLNTTKNTLTRTATHLARKSRREKPVALTLQNPTEPLDFQTAKKQLEQVAPLGLIIDESGQFSGSSEVGFVGIPPMGQETITVQEHMIHVYRTSKNNPIIGSLQVPGTSNVAIPNVPNFVTQDLYRLNYKVKQKDGSSYSSQEYQENLKKEVQKSVAEASGMLKTYGVFTGLLEDLKAVNTVLHFARQGLVNSIFTYVPLRNGKLIACSGEKKDVTSKGKVYGSGGQVVEENVSIQKMGSATFEFARDKKGDIVITVSGKGTYNSYKDDNGQKHPLPGLGGDGLLICHFFFSFTISYEKASQDELEILECTPIKRVFEGGLAIARE